MSGRPRPHIVVGVSRSLAGLAALRFAVAEARLRGIERVTAVRSWVDASNRPAPPWAAAMARQCLDDVGIAVTSAFVTPPDDIVLELRVARGKPGQLLVDSVEHGGAFIVVGASGRFRLRAGVGAFCARHAPCPVVIVPPPAMVGRGRPRRLARSLRRELSDLPQTLERHDRLFG